MSRVRVRCVADSKCGNAYNVTVNGQPTRRGKLFFPHLGIKCPHSECNKYACCDDAVCLAALHHHYNLAHVCDPLLDLTADQLHSLGHALTYHFALDGGLDVARANHAIVSALPDGMDCSRAGHSDLYNSNCSICGAVLGAFAFKEDTGLVCFSCAKANDHTAAPSNDTVRLWSKQ